MFLVCPHSDEFTDFCVREGWHAILSSSIVLIFLVFSIPVPWPGRVRRFIDACKAPFRTYLTVQEAEALHSQSPEAETDKPQFRFPYPLIFLGVLEILGWITVAAHRLAAASPDWTAGIPFLIAFSWAYTVIRPIAWPTVTAPFDLLVVYFVHLVGSVVTIGTIYYEHALMGTPYPSTTARVAIIANLLVVLGALILVLGMPLGVPSSRVRKEDIGHTVSPEDYTSVWQWMTFFWVYPLVKRGRYTTLQEKDVYPVSVTFQSKIIFAKFSAICTSSLLRRIFIANSLDIILDPILRMISVLFAYAGPYCLQNILQILDIRDPTPADKFRAYTYAFAMFFLALAKSQADLQELWIGRRAGTRTRSELMAAIYDKALKRKDFSGVVDKDKDKTDLKSSQPSSSSASASGESTPRSTTNRKDRKGKKGKSKKETEEKDKSDDPKAGADIGKIVNLMSNDANSIAEMLVSLNMLYGAPLELLIGGIYLYHLMGWSAFVGFVTLLAGWPLNSYITKRAFRIRKGLLAARDKRMGVLTELLGGVKFIKFFAWEERWIDRVLDARGVEIKWMIKSRLNQLMGVLLWISAPILISIVSFWAYIALGNQLTISIAFTAVTLFNMIRAPLNVIPVFIVQIIEAGVSLKRIEVFLNEDEVPLEVSSLKDTPPPSSDRHAEEPSLGLVNASFKWNEVTEKDANGGKGKTVDRDSSPSASESERTLPGSDSERSSISLSVDHKFELRNVSVVFPERELTLVTGPTASGKTALLLALLGEMTLLDGRVILSKDPTHVDEFGLMQAISYAAQLPWLQHRSIKDNILFGFPYNEERYNAVLECCALVPDLNVLEDGDATEIGVRGVSLSGGQKARVALARAVYARTKYVLLDDPLSAVDSHTARFLYERLLRGPLLANRTVILVTHHVDLVLPGAHYLVRMLDGRIDTQGTIKELQARGVLEEITVGAKTEIREVEMVKEDVVVVEGEQPKPPTEVAAKAPRKLVEDEKRETGGVKWPVYNSYLKASSYLLWAFLLFIILAQQVISVGDKIWMKIWGEAYSYEEASRPYLHRSLHQQDFFDSYTFTTISHVYPIYSTRGTFGVNWPKASEHPMFYVGIYAAIGITDLLSRVLSRLIQITGGLRASKRLFKRLLVAVTRATFRFHDTTPLGRMLNRFGKDIETIDGRLPQSLQFVNSAFASFFASVLTVAIIYPVFLIPAFFLGLIYQQLAAGYLSTGRDLRRMDSNSKSPIYSEFQELLEGIVTVRAFSAERRFLDVLHDKLDANTKMWYTFWMTNRWLLVNYDAVGATAVLTASLLSISSFSNGAGLAALCITSALNFSLSVYWACRFWTNLELDFNSVERVNEYLNLPQEPELFIENSRPPAYWPSGSNNDALISVEKLSLKYAPDLPEVLHNVSFTLKAGERVGLLGRTGSGKSTLAMSILRFVDPSSGRILIDGIDISTIGLHDLRSRITFIPQDATLFSGTLRENLDPFNEHDDSECLDALYRVQMMTPPSEETSRHASRHASRLQSPTSSRPPSIHESESASVSTSVTELDTKTTISLDTQVSAGGNNFSQGQRQLIAMARALLRRSNIIILDEATSSIDFATDKKIQTAIRTGFNDSLLLTVAHRLRTVIDYDRLIVLDKGKIAEFDTPLALIENKNGIFRDMCLHSGSFEELYTAAKAKASGISAV